MSTLPSCELEYRPQAAKTLRQCLIDFVSREFPRLGGPWITELFADKVLELIDRYWLAKERLKPGQTVWHAVAIDERPSYRKTMRETRQVPVVITVVDQQDIADLRRGAARRQVLKKALVRAANDAYAQGGVLTMVDLSLLFHDSDDRVGHLIREHERETGEMVPRRGNVHDLGRTVSHKAIICRKAFVEGKPTHVIARETFHSPEAVDRYLLDFARVHFAIVQHQMTVEQAAFAIQCSLGLVKEYVRLIEEFALGVERVYDRVGRQLPDAVAQPAQLIASDPPVA